MDFLEFFTMQQAGGLEITIDQLDQISEQATLLLTRIF